MEHFDRKKHWENIYHTKELKDVSWFQQTPLTSLNFIEEPGIPKTAKIIDVGGGDSFLVDALLERGFTDITVVDISQAALSRAQQRLGEAAKKVKWIVADAAEFSPSEKFDLWHDRAAFHFLTSDQEVSNYVNTVRNNLNEGGSMIIGTFSEQGPKKCSGIEIRQYSENKLHKLFSNGFVKEKCINVDHTTPFNTVQNFLFCRFSRNNAVKNLS
jgi:ubiquinone/menaquinone biosynthesis C-methylase UbiE